MVREACYHPGPMSLTRRAPRTEAVPAEWGPHDSYPSPPEGSSSRDRQSLARVVAAVLITRLILYVAGAIAIRVLPSQPRVEPLLGKNLSLTAWVRWDAGWYLSIVERGYSFDPQGPSSVAFFPLFPLLIKGVTLVLGNPVVAGLLVANVAALGAVLALWRWVRAEAGPAEAERAALWLLVYPFSIFLHSIYAESLFFLLVVLAFDANRRGQRLAAGLWSGLAATTRPMGILLMPALAWDLWRTRGARGRLRPHDVIPVLLPAAGLGAYMVYLWIAVGDPWAFWKAHVTGWEVQFQWAVTKYWFEPYWVVTRLTQMNNFRNLLDAMRVLLPVVFIALTVSVFRRLGPAPGIYASLAVAVALLVAPESVGRELLAVVPAFAVLGLTGPRGTLGEALRLASLGLLLLLLLAFVTGRFIG
jgi:Gpi18-like mannosyltransferase